MIIDVSGILKEAGGKIDIDAKLDFADVDFLGENFHFTKPLELKGKIFNNGKSLRLTSVASGSMEVHCARCMSPFVTDIEFDVVENFMQGIEDDTDEDIIMFSGNTIDIDEIVSNNFLMNVEGKYLCSEDCKGLCPSCGKNLNEDSCDCAEDTIDPRWEALKAIMDKA